MSEAWVSVAARLRGEGSSWTDLPAALEKETGIRKPAETIRTALRRLPEYGHKPEPVGDLQSRLIGELAKEKTADQLCQILRVSPRVLRAAIEEATEAGFLISEAGGNFKLAKAALPSNSVHEVAWDGSRVIRFGVFSDPHYGSKDQQMTFAEEIYDTFEHEGIRDVYLPGDLTDGHNMHGGHEFEVWAHGADEQAQAVINLLPSRPGITTHFILGNHDSSHIKAGGHDIGPGIAAARPDMKYLGHLNAQVKLTPNCTMELNHALDGSALAISYATQRYIDSMTGGAKPHILLQGHHHKFLYIFYRHVHALECGCIQAQTPWMKGKRIAAMIGGVIVTVHVNDDGQVIRFVPEFLPLYYPRKNDYPGAS